MAFQIFNFQRFSEMQGEKKLQFPFSFFPEFLYELFDFFAFYLAKNSGKMIFISDTLQTRSGKENQIIKYQRIFSDKKGNLIIFLSTNIKLKNSSSVTHRMYEFD